MASFWREHVLGTDFISFLLRGKPGEFRIPVPPLSDAFVRGEATFASVFGIHPSQHVTQKDIRGCVRGTSRVVSACSCCSNVETRKSRVMLSIRDARDVGRLGINVATCWSSQRLSTNLSAPCLDGYAAREILTRLRTIQAHGRPDLRA